MGFMSKTAFWVMIGDPIAWKVIGKAVNRIGWFLYDGQPLLGHLLDYIFLNQPLFQ